MNNLLKLFAACLVLSLAFAASGSTKIGALAQVEDKPLVQIEPGRITWQPPMAYARLDMTVVYPNDAIFTHVFLPGALPSLSASDLSGPDGLYTYELRLTPVVDAATRLALDAAASDPQERQRVVEELSAAGQLPQGMVLSGTFTIQSGKFVIPVEEPPASPTSAAPSGPMEPNDMIHADDVIITGSLCVGFDCLTDGTENFGFDTIKMKENNLQVFFDDTSTTGFPANDWRLTTNDSSGGGASYFVIEDSTAARRPFRIDAGAPNNSLRISAGGQIGLGTSTPVLKLHLVTGDTPSIRLDQDTSSGWPAQIWDMAGNETHFYVRDTTGGSKLPFRIQPGSPTSSLTLKSNGKVGMGTWEPAYSLEMERTGEDAVIAADRTDGATVGLSAKVDAVQVGSLTNHDLQFVVNNTPVATLTGLGNLTLEGALYEHSDVNAKENMALVDSATVLEGLSRLPILTWNYRLDAAQTQHMGPTAQDFYAAFGLGADNLHIAPLDVNGVSLASIQALKKITDSQKSQITQLESRNIALQQKVERLEARLAALEGANAQAGGLRTFSQVLLLVVVAGSMQLASALYRRFSDQMKERHVRAHNPG